MNPYLDLGRVVTFATEVAKYLLGNFTVEVVGDDLDPTVIMVNGDERIVLRHLTRGDRDKGYITLMGLPASDDLTDHRRLSHQRGPSTRAALTRSPKTVAGQLERNVMVFYRDQLARQKTLDATIAAQRAAEQTEAARIAALIPGATYTPRDKKTSYPTGETIRLPGSAGATATFLVYAHRNGLSYSLSFGDDPAFADDVVALLADRFTAAPSAGTKDPR